MQGTGESPDSRSFSCRDVRRYEGLDLLSSETHPYLGEYDDDGVPLTDYCQQLKQKITDNPIRYGMMPRIVGHCRRCGAKLDTLDLLRWYCHPKCSHHHHHH